MNKRLLGLIIAAFVFGGIAAVSLYALTTRMPSNQPQVVSGKAQIGGPFSLINQDGKRVTEKDFRGRHMLVYFGYTYCPDICPAELQVMSGALDALGAKADQVTPVFVSIDPERDTVEQVKTYVENFHPRLVGLTGSADEVRAAAHSFRVYFKKARSESATEYLMDHSSIVYLMDPNGEFLTHFSYGTGVEKMANGIRKFL